MQDDWDSFDPDAICRDDACGRTDLHPKHFVPRALAARHRPQAHHRPNAAAVPLAPPKRQNREPGAPRALTNAIARATSKSDPRQFSELCDRVRSDYGSAPDRSISRYLARLVERGHVIKLDLGLAFAAYIRPGSRLLGDPESLRELMLGKITETYGRMPKAAI